ncbi:MAG: DUF7266 family protein [Thermoplasmatota archaeon]
MRCDSQGVSEVIGYLLVFGILSMVLVLSMSAFSTGQVAAERRAVELRAESAAARVAGVVVQNAVLWEQQGAGFAVAYLVDLPQQLEGRDYVVRIEKATTVTVATDCLAGAHPDRICVMVPGLGITVTAPVFSAAAPLGLDICNSEAPGGPIHVRINVPAIGAPALASGCTPDDLFLEAT